MEKVKSSRLTFYDRPVQDVHGEWELAAWYEDEAYRLYGRDGGQHAGVSFWLLLAEFSRPSKIHPL